jgi:hypothetical protein
MMQEKCCVNAGLVGHKPGTEKNGKMVRSKLSEFSETDRSKAFPLEGESINQDGLFESLCKSHLSGTTPRCMGPSKMNREQLAIDIVMLLGKYWRHRTTEIRRHIYHRESKENGSRRLWRSIN